MIIAKQTSLLLRCRGFATQLFFLFSLLLVGVLSAPQIAHAGNAVGEIEYRYPCKISGRQVRLKYGFLNQSATIGVGVDRGKPQLFANERDISEQPAEVVTLEYFSACAQMDSIARDRTGNLLREVQSGRSSQRLRQLIFRSDCVAVNRMKREGLLVGFEALRTIFKNFKFERAKQSYYQVRYIDRAKYIDDKCGQ